MKKWYPKWYFDEITDDPNSWGMCCDKERAIECAKEHFDRYERHKWRIAVIIIIAFIAFVAWMSQFAGPGGNDMTKIEIATVNEHTNVYMCPNCFKLFRIEVPIVMPTVATVDDEYMSEYPFAELPPPDMYPTILARFTLECKNICCGDFVDEDLIPIDEEIAPIVSAFNKKGYFTEFSCQGHHDPIQKTFTFPQIVFGMEIAEQLTAHILKWNEDHEDAQVSIQRISEMTENYAFTVDLTLDSTGTLHSKRIPGTEVFDRIVFTESVVLEEIRQKHLKIITMFVDSLPEAE